MRATDLASQHPPPATALPKPLVRLLVRNQTWPNWRARPLWSGAALSGPSGASERAALMPRGAPHLLLFLPSWRALQAGLRPQPATCLSSAATPGASRLLHTPSSSVPSDGEPLPASRTPERSADAFWLFLLAPAFAGLRAYAFQSSFSMSSRWVCVHARRVSQFPPGDK